jgi:hypothetical protein
VFAALYFKPTKWSTMMKNSILILGLCAGLVACGGGSSSSSNNDSTNTQTGVFLDSSVVNIGYRTETLEGVTNSLGEYDYVEGETVTFFIGDLELPPVTAAGTVTPLDLAGSDDTSNSTVVNIIRLLQTLDEDGNPDNGITITETAKSAATQVDFELSITDFESSSAVTNLVANSGSSSTVLVPQSEATAHFEDTLVDEGVDFVANSNIAGIWTTSLTENDLLAFVFFDDGTYAHLEVDTDDSEEISGMEWGTYSKDSGTGQLTVTQTFDGNGDTGLTDAANGLTTLFAQVSGDVLTLQFDDNLNGTIEAGESLDFSRSASSNLLGVWTTALTDNDLLAFVFFADGTYVHLEVDEEAPIDAAGEQSGMEWGTYTRNNTTGELTVTQTFDGNGDTGLTDAANGLTTLFAQVSGDVLALQFDDNLNGTIETDESLDFQRQFSALENDFSFDAGTLAGVYEVTGAAGGDFTGTHQYTFNENGSVDIVYEDGTADTESWSVNSGGQLVFSGTIADVFTLTSGSQSSGNMDLVIDDADGSPVLNTTGTIERIDALPNDFSFDAATLAGVYEVVGTNSDDFAGTHQYTFNENGSVDIVYEDGTADTESWSVNSDGQLVFSGTIADVFTLTSGSQSSGNMDMVIDDADGSPVLNTTGTIERISALP